MVYMKVSQAYMYLGDHCEDTIYKIKWLNFRSLFNTRRIKIIIFKKTKDKAL